MLRRHLVVKLHFGQPTVGSYRFDRFAMLNQLMAPRKPKASKNPKVAVIYATGTIVTGKNSPLLHAASSLILNAAKHLAGLPDSMHLLPPSITESLGRLKKDVLKGREVSLNLDETLIALGISASNNPAALAAVEKLSDLRNCEVHITHMPTPGDEAGLRKLGVNLTSDPGYSTHTLFAG